MSEGSDAEWTEIQGFIKCGRLQVQTEATSYGRLVVVGLKITGVQLTSELLRSIPIGRIQNTLNAPRAAPDEFNAPLRRTPGADPEEFAGRVAAYYLMYAAKSSRPVKLLAEHADIPLPTAHGWVREARLRGKLPPGRAGRAG